MFGYLSRDVIGTASSPHRTTRTEWKRTMHHIAAAARAHARAPIVHASSRRPTRRASVIANVGRSKTNELTGEPEWVEISDAAAAIEDAQEQYGAGDFAGAVKTLEGALKLGGSGVKRDRSKPAELSLGEKQAIFYNLTSAHSKLGAVDRGLEALEALLQAGYCSAQLYGFRKGQRGLRSAAEGPGFGVGKRRREVQANRRQVPGDADRAAAPDGPVAVRHRPRDEDVGVQEVTNNWK